MLDSQDVAQGPSRYLIKGLGRTGSHIISQWLILNQPLYRGHATEHSGTSWPGWDPLYRPRGIWVLHDHTGWLPPKEERSQWVLIISDRRRLLEWAASMWVAEHTGLYSHYATWTRGTRYSVPSQFVQQFKTSRDRWRRTAEAWQLLGWRACHRIWREDLPDSVELPRVAALEPLKLHSNPLERNHSEATPWQYPDIIENWEELCAEFGE